MPLFKKYWKFITAGIVLILILLVTAYIFLFNPKSSSTINQNSTNQAQSKSADGPIKNIGLNIDYYNTATNRAGDFLFTKAKLQFDRVFMPYGFVIPANSTSSGKDKSNPQPTFVVPLGTKVLSLVDGVVFDTPKVWSGDYSVHVSANGQENNLIYETEHVINPLVKKGDKVKAGQVIAEVSDFDKNLPTGYGTVEIGVLDGGKSSGPEHLCPFLYLDPSVKQQILTKLQDLMKNWETYIGDNNLYDESLSNPGCITTEPIAG